MRAPLPTHQAAEDVLSPRVRRENDGVGPAPLMTSVAPSHSVRAHSFGARDWRRLTAVAALSVALLDAVFLQRKHAFFTGGFLSENNVASIAESVLFLLGMLVVDAALIAPLCAFAVFAAHRARLTRKAGLFAAFCAAFLPFAAANFLWYEVWSYLGDAFDFALMFNLTGHRVSEIFAVTAPLVSRPLSLALLLLVGVLGCTWALQRFSGADAPRLVRPPLHTTMRGCVKRLVLGLLVLAVAALWPDSFDFGLRMTPAGHFLGRVFHRLTDFDSDGAGLLHIPRDPAPFNSQIHPNALEIPGNGIDEDGVGGDLPRDRATYSDAAPPLAPWKAKPNVVLFVLESFRGDVVGIKYQGHTVTSVLDSLARSGVRVDSAWSHNGFTSQSRFHILAGSLAGGRQGTTLLDDFKRQGYDVAYFSAQDDSFGDLPTARASVDTYYDARQDVDRRYSAFTTPGSLAVPMGVLEERIGTFLNRRRSNAPLFMYVNFHDTHYPYNHKQLRNLLGITPLAAGLISPRRQTELWSTYLNAAANVDRAVGRVLQAASHALGSFPAAVVIGDHGESLFEQGFLGHGYALNESQLRIPLVVSGLPMRLPVPFGQSQLRDAINDALSGQNGPLDSRPSVTGNGGRVFQYLGELDEPAQIAWRTTTGTLVYDFRVDRLKTAAGWKRPAAFSPEDLRDFRDLVYTWEAMRLTRRGRDSHAP